MSRSADGPLEVRCRTLHPIRHCDVVFRDADPDSLLAAAIEHGASAHGFTPAFYDERRRLLMAAVARSTARFPDRSAPRAAV